MGPFAIGAGIALLLLGFILHRVTVRAGNSDAKSQFFTYGSYSMGPVLIIVGIVVIAA